MTVRRLFVGLQSSDGITEGLVARRDVRFWPKADIPSCTAHVRFRRQSGHDVLQRKCPLLTQSGHEVFYSEDKFSRLLQRSGIRRGERNLGALL